MKITQVKTVVDNNLEVELTVRVPIALLAQISQDLAWIGGKAKSNETTFNPNDVRVSKEEAYKGLAENTRAFWDEVSKLFDNKLISMKEPVLDELRKKHYIPNFTGALNTMEKRGAIITEKTEGRYTEFMLLF